MATTPTTTESDEVTAVRTTSRLAHVAPYTVAAVVLLVGVMGCVSGPDPTAALELKIEKLDREKADLTREIERLKVENEQLAARIAALSGLPPERTANPYALSAVEITGYTNFYDKDKDGKKEKFIVHIKPLDQDADTVKAAGTVDVELWNLNNEDGQALLGKWHIEPDQLRKVWVSALLGKSFRLVFDIPEKLTSFAEPLTVKATFTEFLTGKVWQAQRVIRPLP